jgi:putative tryptophan/tyrosine transport system substrate-binding protein
MRRRDFITLLGGVVAAWPRLASAQASDQMRRVGIMVPLPANDPVFRRNLDGFTGALAKAGWVEGRTVEYAIRSVLDSGESYDKVAADIEALAPDVIVAITETSLAAIKRQAGTTPVVFVIGVGDPVAGSYVVSIPRPGGNITGITDFNPSLGGKCLDLLKQMSPGITRVGIVYGPDESRLSANVNYLQATEEVARKFAVTLTSLVVRDDREIESGLTAFSSQPGGGLMIATYSIFSASHRRSIIEAAARHRLPAVYAQRFFATDGGLMAYSIDQLEEMRQAAYLVDRILRGAKPADLPVQTPNAYQLVINLKAAQALGITVSTRELPD